MIVINNNCSDNTRYHFDHNNVELAFAQTIASNKHCLAILMIDSDHFIDENIKGKIVVSEKGYELGELAIPFDSIKGNAILH